MAHKLRNHKPDLSQSLREQARQLLPAKQGEATTLSTEELKALVYELDIHRTELEMQNEELRQAQVELAHALDRYYELYEVAPVGYITLKNNGQIIAANQTAARMLGVKRQALVGVNLSKCITRPSQDVFYLHRKTVFSSDLKQTCELDIHKEDGTTLSVRLESVAFALEQQKQQQPHCQTILIDITEQKKAEKLSDQHLEEAAHLQRTMMANELATGLAHELNQPLAAIAMMADSGEALLAQSPLDQSQLQENLQQINKQALRGGAIIRGMMALVKKKPLASVALDLNALLSNTCSLLRKKAESAHITITLELDKSLPPVMAVGVYIEQVLLNLLRNAIDAIDETRANNGQNSGQNSGQISIKSSRQENMARVTVRDSGSGVDEHVAKRLFESFYSTKDQGLGIGLTISLNLIQSLGGRLWAESQQGGGVFHFELPLVS